MKNILLLLFIILCDGIYAQHKLDIVSAEISFTFVSNGVVGTLTGFSSSSTLDLANLETSELMGSVVVKTIKTGNFLRDWSLKGGKYFNADTYPKITFESSSIEKTNNGIRLIGQLTIKDTSKQIDITFIKMKNKLIGTLSLFSSDYGIHIKKKRADNKVNVHMVLALE
ncbi:MAG: YceI family protein [Flavobacteriaceae bacterium]